MGTQRTLRMTTPQLMLERIIPLHVKMKEGLSMYQKDIMKEFHIPFPLVSAMVMKGILKKDGSLLKWGTEVEPNIHMAGELFREVNKYNVAKSSERKKKAAPVSAPVPAQEKKTVTMEMNMPVYEAPIAPVPTKSVPVLIILLNDGKMLELKQSQIVSMTFLP